MSETNNPSKPRNTLITIGYIGCKQAYLNVPIEEAKARYRASDGLEPDEEIDPSLIDEFTFIDEFQTYEANSSSS